MLTISHIATGLVAALHLGFLVLEMFLWDSSTGLKVFRQTPEHAAQSKVLAANKNRCAYYPSFFSYLQLSPARP